MKIYVLNTGVGISHILFDKFMLFVLLPTKDESENERRNVRNLKSTNWKRPFSQRGKCPITQNVYIIYTWM